MVMRGRVLQIESSAPPCLVIRNDAGTHTVEVDAESLKSFAHDALLGGIVEVQGKLIYLLTPNRTSKKKSEWMAHILDPRRKRALEVRARIEAGIRQFFNARGFLETRTPLLVPCPGMETHIRPFRAIPHASEAEFDVFLPTSPEFAMKRLLVGGLEKIFQLSHAFRDEPMSPHHHPEFLMLEWYRAYAGYEDIARDTEELVEALALSIHGKPEFRFGGRTIQVSTPWPRLRIRDLFQEFAGVNLVDSATVQDLATHAHRLGLSVDLERENWDDIYFKIWLNCIEPKLPENRAVFVMRYPPSQAALAVVDSDPDGSRWARRFEVYAGGIELANAFEELTDPIEQRNRFVEDMDLRSEVYGAAFPKNPIDEEFLDALSEGMPPSGGIALGVDRLVMLLADEPEIDYTVWLRPGPPRS